MPIFDMPFTMPIFDMPLTMPIFDMPHTQCDQIWQFIGL